MSKSHKENKVSVQKGPINAAEMTSKQMTHRQNEALEYKHIAMRKDGQTLHQMGPKK